MNIIITTLILLRCVEVIISAFQPSVCALEKIEGLAAGETIEMPQDPLAFLELQRVCREILDIIFRPKPMNFCLHPQ